MQRVCDVYWCTPFWVQTHFHTFWVQTYVTFFVFENGLLPHCWHRQYFDSPFATTWLKIWSFILVPAFPEVLRDCTFPGFQAQVHLKTLAMEYYSHESCKTISKKSPQLQLLTKRKKTTTTFWNGFAHDKLTQTSQINQHLPYLHYTPWKDLALVRLHVFSQPSTSALLTKLDLATNNWWQRCNFVVSPGNKQIVSIQCVIKCSPGFPLHFFSLKRIFFPLEVLLAACFLGWYLLNTYVCPSVYREVVT